MSDELIEAMARCIHAELSRANVMAYLDMPDTTPETLARSLLPIIRAHLEPTSEMLAIGNEAVDTCTKVDPCDNPAKHIWADMLAASPIGDVG